MYESCNVWTRRESCHIYEGVMSDICHTYGSHVFHVWMSHIWTKCIKRFWRGVATMSRLLKISGLFCRISSFYRALWQKRPILLRKLLIVATACLYGIVSEEDLSHRMCLTHDWITSHMRVSPVTYIIEIMSRRISQCVNWSISHISHAWNECCARVTWCLWIASCHVTSYESDDIAHILYVN